MQKRHVVGAVAAAITLAVPVAATAGSGTDRATGGGQVLVDTAARGAGDTIAFTAQGTASAAKGQVQVVDRTNGDKFHGIVRCLAVKGTMAEIGAEERDNPGQFFRLVVQDNRQGANAENDTIVLDRTVETPECGDDEDDDDEPELALARGNAQVYDAQP